MEGCEIMELSDDVRMVKHVGPKKAQLLKKLGIETVYDLITYYPRAYEDESTISHISELHAGERESVLGTIMNISERIVRRNMTILKVMISDGTGFVQVVWFNQRYLKKQLKTGSRIFIKGKVQYAYGGHGQLSISNISDYQILDDEESPETGIQPVYAATEKITQKYLRSIMHAVLDEMPAVPEMLPESLLQKTGMMRRRRAMSAIHFPDDYDELRQARERLAFEELYIIQCGLFLLKKESRDNKNGVRHLISSHLVDKVIKGFPYTLTRDQEKAWREIEADMERNMPMRRLLEGDVGSGKTAIAALALTKTVENGYQGALMAPTEILARQHYENFSHMLEGTGINIGFLSGHLTKKQRDEMHDNISSHRVDIVIGTHALIQDSVTFDSLGLVVTDEQHRFGVEQRAALEKKGHSSPDVLVMTATPIPRTMTLTVYGDLDISVIHELPPGRNPVRTFLRTPDRRTLIYQYVRSQIEEGRQAYVVCPLIETSEESTDIPSAEEVYAELSNGIFNGIPCGIVHGRLKSTEKEDVMRRFHDGSIKLLVATTVIEVGVNVPNASIMVIENADRFGLAQLHQLRGRVGRGPYKSFCILVSANRSDKARERLGIMEKISDGFRLAEEDLKLRGPGQFFGNMQHGLPDLKIADVIGDMDLLVKARRAAIKTMSSNEELEELMPILATQYKRQFLRITEN